MIKVRCEVVKICLEVMKMGFVLIKSRFEVILYRFRTRVLGACLMGNTEDLSSLES